MPRTIAAFVISIIALTCSFNSIAEQFRGKTVAEWTETYWREAEKTGADPSPDARVKRVAFLPIFSPVSPGDFGTIEIEVGTGLVLPVIGYLGFPGDDYRPDEWFDVDYASTMDDYSGEVYVNGTLIDSSGVKYISGYTGVIDFDPLLQLFVFDILFNQHITYVLKPLPVGTYEINVKSRLNDSIDVFAMEYDNTWTVVVKPRSDK